MIAGKDRGKKGTVLKAIPAHTRVVVEGINIVKRHIGSRRSNGRGQIVEKPMPVHVSNVMLVDPKTGTRTRIARTKKDGKTVRVTARSRTTLK